MKLLLYGRRARRSDATSPRGAASLLGLLMAIFGLAVIAPDLARAQHGTDVGQAPPPPPGPGRLVVTLVSQEPGLVLENLDLALYALDPEGMPGLANAATDAEGRHVFEGISNDPRIVYLVGARLGEIPFGERVTFVEGELEAAVTIQVSTPTAEAVGVSIDELRVRADWMGDRVVVTETLRLTSAGERVIQLEAGDGGDALFERVLPQGATDFETGPSSIGDDLQLDQGRISFWGPLYPGEQNVEYRFSLPLAPGERNLRIPVSLDEPTARFVALAGTTGMQIAGPGLERASVPGDDGAESGERWARAGLGAGEGIDLSVTLPESRTNPLAVTLPRTDVWVDLDDTRLEANVELQLAVSPGAPVSGTPSAPLLHVTLPTGAQLEGVSPEAEGFGLIPTEDGGFDVVGPIGPGEHAIGYAFRMPSRPDGVELDLRFPREVQTLNVLVADTGLALDSRRLHRRRPFRNRTRNYLHREAYNVTMAEEVDLRLVPLRGAGLPQEASLAVTLVAAGGGAWFLAAPLLGGRRRGPNVDAERARLRDARESVYADIADLEHDFETGKLDEDDYQAMHGALRGQAIELLREERARTSGPAPTAAEGAPSVESNAATMADTRDDAAAAETAAPIATGGFCPACGGQVAREWHFCSHCGSALQPDPDQGAQG